MFNIVSQIRKLRAERDEARQQFVQIVAALEIADRRAADRSTLLSIHKDGRRIVFTFARNNEVHRIGAIGTWDDDIEGWKKLLIDPLPDANDGEAKGV